MEDFRNNYNATVSRVDANIDQGLRSYMLGIYNLMAIGLVVTALVAMAFAYLATAGADGSYVLRNGTSLSNFGMLLYTSPLRFVVMFAPLIAVFFLSFKIMSLSTAAARGIFYVYAALVGASLSSIFLVYTSASIVQTFFVTAASFGALSLYGYVTKRNLSAFGSFLVMGLFGLLFALLVNLFVQSSALQFAISVAGVLIFAGLTAYDTQSIKQMYFEGDADETMGRKAVLGALTLYLDFINLFVYLLRFIGNRD